MPKENLPNQKKNQGKNLLISMLVADNEKEEYKAQEFMEIDKLVHYSNHPFRLYEGQRLDGMVRSIKELGVIVPIIIRPLADRDDRFEILSGHNRVNASRVAGLFEVPLITISDLISVKKIIRNCYHKSILKAFSQI